MAFQIESRLVGANFPSELLLKVLENVPCSNGSISTLAKTHPRIASLMNHYEKSMTKTYLKRDLPHVFTDFPSNEKRCDYAFIQDCVTKYDMIDEIMDILTAHDSYLPVEPQNQALVYTGLLLLTHMSTIGLHSEKIAYLNSLARDPLTAIHLTIHIITQTATHRSPPGTLINIKRYPVPPTAAHREIKSNIKHAFKEGCLSLGPEFIHAFLKNAKKSEPILLNLFHNHADRGRLGRLVTPETAELVPITEGPMPEVPEVPEVLPEEREKKLVYAIASRLKDLTGTRESEVDVMVREECSEEDHRLAWMGNWGRESFMKGLDLQY
jgi:hypothetical protein